MIAVIQAPKPKKNNINPGKNASKRKSENPIKNQINVDVMDSPYNPFQLEGKKWYFFYMVVQINQTTPNALKHSTIKDEGMIPNATITKALALSAKRISMLATIGVVSSGFSKYINLIMRK